MTGPNKKLISAVEAYFTDMGRVHASGGGTGERSYYPALANLLCAVGDTLKPKVFCVLEGADQGAGHPDYALYTAKQVQKGRPREGQVSYSLSARSARARGVVPQFLEKVLTWKYLLGLVWGFACPSVFSVRAAPLRRVSNSYTEGQSITGHRWHKIRKASPSRIWVLVIPTS